MGRGQYDDFDASATVASPMTPERAAAFGGPAPLRPPIERPPVERPLVVEAPLPPVPAFEPPPPPIPSATTDDAAIADALPAEVAAQLPQPPVDPVEEAFEQLAAREPEGDDITSTVQPVSRTYQAPEPIATEEESDSWVVDSKAGVAPVEAGLCPNCGNRNAAGMSFCIRCGSRLGAPAEEPAVPVAELSSIEPEDDPSTAATMVSFRVTQPPPPPPPFPAAPEPPRGPEASEGPFATRGGFGLGPDSPTVATGPGDGDTGGPEPRTPDFEKTALFGVQGVACDVCGADNDTVSAFCVRCGAKLGEVATGPESASGTFAASRPRFEALDGADAATIVPDLGGPTGGPESRSQVRTPTTRCPNCRASNDVLASFCVTCGTSLKPDLAPPAAPPPPPAPAVVSGALPKTCPSCGVANEPDVRFCVSCGTSLSRDPFAAQRTPEPPPPSSSAEAVTAVGISFGGPSPDAPTAVGLPFPPSPVEAPTAVGLPFPPPPLEAPTAVGLPFPPPPAAPPPPPSRDPFARTPAAPRVPESPGPLRDPFSKTPATPPPPLPYPVSSQPSFSPPADDGGRKMGPLMMVGIVLGAAAGAGIALAIMQVMGVGLI